MVMGPNFIVRETGYFGCSPFFIQPVAEDALPDVEKDVSLEGEM
jgi:hypothetical protein